MMEHAKPIAEQIAADIEDVQALLADNRSLSVALLSRRIRDLEEDARDRFRQLSSRLDALTRAAATIDERLALAGVLFKEMQADVDALKGERPQGDES